MAWPKYKTKELVPADILPMYEEKDGEWQVKPEHVPLGDKGELALDAERKEKKLAEDARKKAEDALKESEAKEKKTQAALTKVENEAEAKRVGKTSEELAELTEKIKEGLDRDKAAEIQAFQDTIKDLTGVKDENRDLKLVQKVKEQFRASGVRKNKIDDLWELEKAQFELTKDGNPLAVKDPSKTVKIFIEDTLKKARPDYFEGSKGDGGGSGDHLHRMPPGGVTSDDVLKDPKAAINAARAAGKE